MNMTVKNVVIGSVLLASLGGTLDADARGQVYNFDAGKSAAQPARLQLLDDAGVVMGVVHLHDLMRAGAA